MFSSSSKRNLSSGSARCRSTSSQPARAHCVSFSRLCVSQVKPWPTLSHCSSGDWSSDSAVPRPPLMNWTTAHLKPWPSERSNIPSAALVFPLPSPVWTMISPLRRRAAFILPRISCCIAFISASWSDIGELQLEGHIGARAHSEDFEDGHRREHFLRAAVGDQPAALEEQHAIEGVRHAQVVQADEESGAPVPEPSRQGQHFQGVAHVQLRDGLVPELQSSPGRDRAGEAHPLAFASAEPG